MGEFSDFLLGRNQQPQDDASGAMPEGPGRFARLPQNAGGEQAVSFSEMLLGPKSAPMQAQPAQEPDNRGMLRRAYDTVAGREDERYKGIRSLDEELQDENKGNFFQSPELRQLRTGAMTAGDDKVYGDIMKNALGDRFVRKETDKYGQDVIVYRKPDGSENRAYVNKPGLDTEDVGRALTGAIPYLATALPVGRAVQGAGWAVRGLAQGLTAAGTSVATDVASMPLGSEQGVDLTRAAITGGLGAVGEPIASGIARWQARGLIDKSTGLLNDKGRAAAISAGLDPDAISKQFATEFSKVYTQTPAAARTQLGEQLAPQAMGIRSSAGQRAKDAEQLLQEKGMRYGLYGDKAKSIIQEFDQGQADDLARVAIGEVVPSGQNAARVQPGIATTLAPHRAPGSFDRQSLGESINTGLSAAKEAAKIEEKAAWSGVQDLLPKREALDILPDSIGASLGPLRPDKEVTPIAWGMAKQLDQYMTGKPMQEELAILGKTSGITTVDEMRRRLLSMTRGASNNADREMASRIYDGFNEWIGEAAKQQLLAGNPQAAANLSTARGITREMKQIFEPSGSSGTKTAGGRLLSTVMESADSPERIVSQLFFSGKSPGDLKAGTVEALSRMKLALDRYPSKDIARDTWNDVRASYWMKLVQGGNGELNTPTVMLSNIKTALEKQRSVLDKLFEPAELAQIARFQKALEQITYKDPNPSGSGVAAASFAKQFIGKIFDAVGGNSRAAQMAIEYSGIGRAYGTAAAKSAVQQRMRLPMRGYGPEGAAAGSIYGKSEE